MRRRRCDRGDPRRCETPTSCGSWSVSSPAANRPERHYAGRRTGTAEGRRARRVLLQKISAVTATSAVSPARRSSVTVITTARRRIRGCWESSACRRGDAVGGERRRRDHQIVRAHHRAARSPGRPPGARARAMSMSNIRIGNRSSSASTARSARVRAARVGRRWGPCRRSAAQIDGIATSSSPPASTIASRSFCPRCAAMSTLRVDQRCHGFTGTAGRFAAAIPSSTKRRISPSSFGARLRYAATFRRVVRGTIEIGTDLALRRGRAVR